MYRRGQAWRSFLSYSYWLRITVSSALPARAMRKLMFGGWGGGDTSLSIEFWARNHATLEHIGFVVSHGRSGVPLSSNRLRYHGLTSALQEDRLGKQALETPCHTRIAISPQDTTGHVSGPAEPNVTWHTNFPR